MPLTVEAGLPVTDELTVCVELRDTVDVAVCVGVPVTVEVTVAAAVPVDDKLPVDVALGVVDGDAPKDRVAVALVVGLPVTDDVEVRDEVELRVRAGLPDAVDVGEDEQRHVSTLLSNRRRPLDPDGESLDVTSCRRAVSHRLDGTHTFDELFHAQRTRSGSDTHAPHPSDAHASVVVGEGVRVNVADTVLAADLLPVVVALGVVEGDAP